MAARIIVADVLDGLRTLPAAAARCVVTSPPYWGLRDYGVDGQIGLEATPEEYVDRLLAVFAEVWRVLAEDGTVWLNLGDSYCSASKWGGSSGTLNRRVSAGDSDLVPRNLNRGRRLVGDTKNPNAGVPTTGPNRNPQVGLKDKDLVGIPWRVAFALQAAGWWLRSDIVWDKPNPMPESVTDRPTRCHEYLFLLARSERYYYDAAAIAEPVADGTLARLERAHACTHAPGQTAHRGVAGERANRRQRSVAGAGAAPQLEEDPEVFSETRNRRTVWRIATRGFSEAHFATFPDDLVEPCILAGSSRGDTVLDPFAGAGTVGLVADRLGRHFIGVELNPEYAGIAQRRLTGDSPLFASVDVGPPSRPEGAQS